jgi:hypothetical protein
MDEHEELREKCEEADRRVTELMVELQQALLFREALRWELEERETGATRPE